MTRIPFPYVYEEAKAALHADQSRGVLSLANSGDRTDRRLKEVDFFVFDLLDTKYGAWLRESAYQGGRRTVPIVPQLALQLSDFEGLEHPLLDLLIAWTTLALRLAHRLEVFPSFSAGRPSGFVPTHLEWSGSQKTRKVRRGRWDELPIPKARQGERWPLTKHEGGID